jgi:hypothetical protein
VYDESCPFRRFPKKGTKTFQDSKKHSPSFSLRLQKGEDVVKPDGTLDVSDDRSVGLVHELDSDLGNTSSRSGSAENLYCQYSLFATDH